jgi:hypothetical protein
LINSLAKIASSWGSITAFGVLGIWSAFCVSTPHRQLTALLQAGKGTVDEHGEQKKIIVKFNAK